MWQRADACGFIINADDVPGTPLVVAGPIKLCEKLPVAGHADGYPVGIMTSGESGKVKSERTYAAKLLIVVCFIGLGPEELHI